MKKLMKNVAKDVMFMTAWLAMVLIIDEYHYRAFNEVTDYIEEIIWDIIDPIVSISPNTSETIAQFVVFGLLAAFISFGYRYVAGFVKGLFNK